MKTCATCRFKAGKRETYDVYHSCVRILHGNGMAHGHLDHHPDPEHPVVRTHPETGEKVLFVNGFTTHFSNFHTPATVRVGQDYTLGRTQLLDYLISQAAIPEYQVRWRWKPNSVAIWDNRATMHRARPFDDTKYRRELRRTTTLERQAARAQPDHAKAA